MAGVNLIPQIKFRYTDANGFPLVAGKVFTYVSGTSTLLETYSDAAGTVPNTNPVILDARGEADIFLKAGKSYRITVKDKDDALIETTDKVYGAAPAGGDGWLDVTAYGAVGDGVTDCTAAFQAALNAGASSATTTPMQGVNKTIYVPAGEYVISSMLIMPGRVNMLGDGMDSSIMHFTNAGSTMLVAGADITYSHFEKMKWVGPGNTTAAVGFLGSVIFPNIFVTFDKIFIEQFSIGFHLSDTFNCSWDDCRIRDNGVVGTLAGGNANDCTDSVGGGIAYDRVTFVGAASTGNKISNCYITGNGRGVYVIGNDRITSHTFEDVKLESNYIGLDVDGRDSAIGISKSTVLTGSTYFEANIYAGALLGEGESHSPYRNNTTAGTGLPGSCSTGGPDGVVFLGRYLENYESRFVVGNNNSTTVDHQIFAIDKADATAQITKALFGTAAIKFVTGAGIYGGQKLISTSGTPEGATGARVGSFALDRSVNDYSTAYIKVDGSDDTDDTGWWPLHERRYGLTAARPTPGTGADGALYYNTTYSDFDTWNGSAWVRVNGLRSGLFASIPTGVAAMQYYATDLDHTFLSDGVRWRSVQPPTKFAAATNGGTTTIQARGGYYVNSSGAIASHTVTMPSGTNAVSGDKVTYTTNGAITTLTVNAGAATVLNAPTTLATGTSFEFVYNDSSTTWYRVR